VIQRTFTCSKDVRLVNNSGTFSGNGQGPTLSCGQVSGNQTRSELEMQLDFSGAISVSQALLRLQATVHCGAFGGNVIFVVEEASSGFQEGSYAGECDSSTSNAEKWPGQTTVTTNRAVYNHNPADGDLVSVDITAMVEAARAAGKNKIRLVLFASDGTGAHDESNSARFVGFWSVQGKNYKPRIEAVLDDTYAPDAPSDVAPVTTNYQAQGQAATRVDTSFIVTGRFTEQAVAGKPAPSLNASQFQLYNQYAADGGGGSVTGGTKLLDTVKSNYPTGSLDITHPVTITSPVGAEVRGRIRVQGNNGKWSPWTLIAAMRLIPNNRPTAPTSLSSDSLWTLYSGHHNDPDANSSMSGVETQVVIESASGFEMIQNTTSYHEDIGDSKTGKYTTFTGTGMDLIGGGTNFTIGASGRTLAAGERPQRRHRTVDQFGAVGAWSAWVAGVVGSGTLPTAIPDPSAKQDDLTPLLGASYSEAITGMIVEAYGSNDLTQLLWQPAEKVVASVTSATREYGTNSAGVPLQWGQPLWIRAAVRVASTGGLTGWTDLSFVDLNSLPNAPTLSIDGSTVGNDGILRVGSLAPRINMPFSDPDLPGDSPSKQIATVTTPGGVAVYSATATSGIEQFADIPTSAGLAWETPYVASGQYADTSGQTGPVGFLAFTTHRPPSLALGTAPVAADPTPTLNWTPTFYGGATQKGYQVVITDVTGGGSDQVFDSGFVADTAATSYVVPAYELVTGRSYQAAVTITDTLGIAATLNGITIVLFTGSAAFSMTATAHLTVTDALPTDTFTRSVTDGWGTATSGSVWSLLNHPEDFDTTGTTGTIALSTAGATRKSRLIGPNYSSITALAEVKADKLAVGGTITAALAVVSIDLSNACRAELVMNTDQTMDLKIVQINAGSRAILATFRTALTHTANQFYWIKVNTAPGQTTGGPWTSFVQAKAWQDGMGEPGSYQVSAQANLAAGSTGPNNFTSGSVGLDGLAGSGITNAPVLLTWDALSSTSP
jgi:hypothetical protein